MPSFMEARSIILIRGLPGSGKTSLAKLLSENGKYPVFSVDEYFTDAQTGAYTFDHKRNYLAYAACEENAKRCMMDDCEKIFIDNTFTLEWEMEPYFQLADKFGYQIFVITVENRHGGKNTHGITEEQLEKMASKYNVKLIP